MDSIIVKSNKIIFVDIDFGYAYTNNHSFSSGISVNYQHQNDFYKVRFTQNYRLDDAKFVAIFPVSGKETIYNEVSLMYGKRLIRNDLSYHFTMGISYNELLLRDDFNVFFNDFFIGFPIEIGMHSFPSEKERFRILYGLIPVGKPTSFARATSLKIKANIAKQSYIGISIGIGLGMYKKY